MSTTLQLRGGTTAEHSAFTGAIREVTVDTTKDVVVVHDGSTVGGIPMLREDMSNLSQNAVRSATLRDIPPNQKNAAYTLALTDRGMGVDMIAAGTVTIPANASVAFPTGSTITITNYTASSISIAPASGVTLIQAGTSNTGARSLANYGIATVRKVNADVWFIVGAGLS